MGRSVDHHERKTKHTPGPWFIDDGMIDLAYQCEYIKKKNEWVSIGPTDEDGGVAGVIALCHPDNASLIAAAPELLEALKALYENCSMVHSQWGDGSNQKQANEAIERGKAAIRKATEGQGV